MLIRGIKFWVQHCFVLFLSEHVRNANPEYKTVKKVIRIPYVSFMIYLVIIIREYLNENELYYFEFV